MADGRPNILFAFGDDWGRYASAYRQVEREDMVEEVQIMLIVKGEGACSNYLRIRSV